MRVVRVTDVNPGSEACPTLIPEVTITPHAIALAVVMGVGVLLLLRELLAVTEEDDPSELEDDRAAGGVRGALARIGLGGRWATTVAIAAGTAVALLLVNAFLGDSEGFGIEGIPVEPIALVVLLALSPVAAYVATARDSRRFVLGALGAMGFWFVLWYPNISGLPLPAAIHNAYQGFLPTYLYPFQFSVSNSGAAAPPLLRDRARDHARRAAVHERCGGLQRLVVARRARRAKARPAGCPGAATVAAGAE